MLGNSVLVYLRKILPLLALFALSDAHWGVMQLATWVEMTIDSAAKNESVLAAVQQTLTGEKKCPRCRQLEDSRKQDDKRSVQWETKTLAISARDNPNLFPPIPPFEGVIFEHQQACSRSDAPISPPPWS